MRLAETSDSLNLRKSFDLDRFCPDSFEDCWEPFLVLKLDPFPSDLPFEGEIDE